jgi:hypothetical protein
MSTVIVESAGSAASIASVQRTTIKVVGARTETTKSPTGVATIASEESESGKTSTRHAAENKEQHGKRSVAAYNCLNGGIIFNNRGCSCNDSCGNSLYPPHATGKIIQKRHASGYSNKSQKGLCIFNKR